MYRCVHVINTYTQVELDGDKSDAAGVRARLDSANFQSNQHLCAKRIPKAILEDIQALVPAAKVSNELALQLRAHGCARRTFGPALTTTICSGGAFLGRHHRCLNNHLHILMSINGAWERQCYSVKPHGWKRCRCWNWHAPTRGAEDLVRKETVVVGGACTASAATVSVAASPCTGGGPATICFGNATS